MMLALAAALCGCGGGGSGSDAAQTACASVDVVSMAGAGNLLSITISNPDVAPRRFTLHGQVRFSGQASGTAGGYSTLLLTDGQSPVDGGAIQALAAGQAQGLLLVSTNVHLQAGASATWHLAHAPLPAPYGWSSMRFTSVELCAE